MDALEQITEVNRIRDLIANALKDEQVHPRELSLSLIMVAIEAHISATNMPRAHIRRNLKEMVDYLIKNAQVVQKTGIQ